jgi:hypothetical protein
MAEIYRVNWPMETLKAGHGVARIHRHSKSQAGSCRFYHGLKRFEDFTNLKEALEKVERKGRKAQPCILCWPRGSYNPEEKAAWGAVPELASESGKPADFLDHVIFKLDRAMRRWGSLTQREKRQAVADAFSLDRFL